MALRAKAGEPGIVQSPPLLADGGVVVVADAQLLFTGEYSRLGDDLLLSGGDGTRQVITGYFAAESPPVLASPGGAVMTPEVVAQLAGPRAAGQYAQVGTGEAPVAIGQVESVNGSAQVIRAGLPAQLEPGDPVFQNDVVQTGLASDLVIGFADGTVFSLSANARLVLNGMVYDPAGSSNSLTLSVVHGVFSFVTGQIAPTGGIEVNTPVATLGIRGTTVHGILESIAGPLTVFLGQVQLGALARVVLADPLTRVPIGTLDNLGLAFTLSSVGARPFVRALTAVEQEFSLKRAEVIHGVQSTFDFRYSTGESIVQPGETLRTQAAPNLPSGGIGFDRESGAGDGLGGGLLQGLEGSPTLALLEGIPLSRLALGNAPKIFTSATLPGTVEARVELAEASATTGAGTASSGQIVLTGGTTPVQSFALVGLTFAAGGAPLSLTSGGVPVTVVQSDTQAQGLAGGVPVFLFILNPDGSFTFSLLRPLDHPIAGATGASDTIDIGFDVVVTFTDGATLQTSILSVVLDSGPEAASDTEAVNEASGLGVPVTGNLSILGGGDGVKSVELIGQSAALTAGGLPVALVRVSEDTFVGRTPDGTAIFRMTFDGATGDYAFTLLRAIDQPGPGADSVNLVFRVAVTDGDNDTVVSTITITAIDDVPVAQDDTDSLSAGANVAGNVLDGGEGADIQGADGAQVTGIAAGGSDGAVSGGVGAEIETALGTLTLSANGTYDYTAKPNVAGIDTFTYTITDGDGDTSTATLSLTVNESRPTVAPAVAQVDEAGLDAADVAPGDDLGSDPDSNSETTGALNLTFDDPDAPVRVVMVGFGATSAAVPADNSDVSLAGSFGTLTIRADGTYAYALFDNADHGAGAVFETFDYTVSDAFGNSSSSTITVEIVGDEPIAHDDTNFLSAGANAADNVLDGGEGAGSSGADGAQVTGVAAGTFDGAVSGGVGAAIETALGTLTLNAGGSYDYVAKTNVSGTDTFTYTITDGDGDSATATLSLTVNESRPTVAPAAAQVDEAGLDAGDVAPGDDLGSDPDSPNETTGALNLVFADPDAPVRVVSVAFGGTAVAVPADNTDVTIDGASGTLSLRADGTYSYALTDNADHGDGPASEIFAYTVSDGFGNTASETITIDILDDAPFVSENAPQTVQESALEHGSGGGTAVATGTLGFASGADGASITAISLGALTGVLDGDELLIAGGFFEFRVDTLTGDYTYTLTDGAAHENIGLVGADDQVVQNFSYTVTDGDGDTAVGALIVRIDDDGPSVVDIAVVHDETPGVDPVSDDTGDAPPLPAEIAALGLEIGNVSKKPIAFFYGGDGAGGIALDPVADPQNGDPSGLFDAATGQPILLFNGPDGTIVGRVAAADGELTFVSILGDPTALTGPDSAASADLWFVQYRAIQHDNPFDPDEVGVEGQVQSVTDTITFEGLAEAVVSEVFGDRGSGPIGVEGISSRFPDENRAAVFDSSTPDRSGDLDIGTPNETFGGPGTIQGDTPGTGGEVGGPFPNNVPLGKILIVTADLENPTGVGRSSTFKFDFSSIGPVTANEITVIDIEQNESDGSITLIKDSGPPTVIPLPVTGQNGVAVVDLGDTTGVLEMIVALGGSGAIDNIVFTRPVSFDDESLALGYTVTDTDGDTTAGTATITIEDDGPEAADDPPVYVPAGATVSGLNVLTGQDDIGVDDFGTDGPAPDDALRTFTFTGNDGFGNPGTLSAPAGLEVTSFAGGKLTVHEDGTWTYIAPAAVGGDTLIALDLDADAAGFVDDFTYFIEDGDGDRDSATQPVRVVLDPSRAQFGDGSDDILGGSGTTSDFLAGGGGHDIIDGGEGGDLLFGDGGEDLLVGGEGDDLMYGDHGADTLDGGPGADTLTGGPGADLFILRPGDGGATLAEADLINDFRDGVDHLGLDGISVAEITVGGDGAGNAAISIGGEILAVVVGVDPLDVTSDDFLNVV